MLLKFKFLLFHNSRKLFLDHIKLRQMASANLTSNNELIPIDGSLLEGGGQILRISTALSVLLNKPIKVDRIRAGRKDGGLKAQHLTGIRLLGEISKAKLINDEIKSTELTFTPTCLNSGEFIADTKTAGSITLLIQNSLPCLLFSKGESSLHLRGGTNTTHAPQIDFFKMVFTPLASNFGIKTECEIKKRGYYPKGGGEVFLRIYPIKELKPIDLTDFGSLKRIYVRSFVAGYLPIEIAHRMAQTANQELKKQFKTVPIEIDIVKEPEHTYIGVGTGIIIVAETTTGCILGGSGIGEKGVSAERVAQDAVDAIYEDLKYEICVDEYMQDQLIIFMGLANGTSRIKTGKISLHTQTAIHYTQLLTGATFKITKIDAYNIIECTGVGYKNKFIN